ncbi:MAG: NUDIX domain-containing protein [Armatimonadota bacterium]
MPTLSTDAVNVLILHRDAGRPLYLLLRDAEPEAFAGHWRLAIGTVGSGETVMQAALREATKVTGQQPISLWVLDRLNTFFDARYDRLHLAPVFVAEVPEGRTSKEAGETRWITFEQAQELLRWPGQRDSLRQAHEEVVTPNDRGAPFRLDLKG